MTTVRAAIVQAAWTGDKESMIKAHEDYAREAAAQGAQVICFQELFYGPVLLPGAGHSSTTTTPSRSRGPTTERFQALAKELGMVMVLPMYEEEQPGVLYNTAAVMDADGTYLGKYRKHHIPHLKVLGEVLLPARATSATRSSRPPSARSASTSATTGTSPRGGGSSA